MWSCPGGQLCLRMWWATNPECRDAPPFPASPSLPPPFLPAPLSFIVPIPYYSLLASILPDSSVFNLPSSLLLLPLPLLTILFSSLIPDLIKGPPHGFREMAQWLSLISHCIPTMSPQDSHTTSPSSMTTCPQHSLLHQEHSVTSKAKQRGSQAWPQRRLPHVELRATRKRLEGWGCLVLRKLKPQQGGVTHR